MSGRLAHGLKYSVIVNTLRFQSLNQAQARPLRGHANAT